ncbi:MAG TPA: SDR family oxidoreductase [Kofleriaceae bacterium]|jgi:nucleoside-diphosphate-sugar epimerase
MRIFITGSTGFIGSAVVRDLITAGHTVLGLVRSDANAKALDAVGGTALRGDLDDLDVLRRGAESTDGVIHIAFHHDFSNFAECCAKDQRAITAMGEVLAGSNRPLVITSGTPVGEGRVVDESDLGDRKNPISLLRAPAEDIARGFASRGVRSSIVCLPRCVHGTSEQGWKAGLLIVLTQIAKKTGVVAYIGDGSARWPAVHRLDAARLYCLAVEKAPAGSRVHAVGEEGISLKEIAMHLAAKLGLPVVSKTPGEAAAHFGFFAASVSTDQPASAPQARALGWQPREIGLLADLDANG